jgi:16S rRNA (cytidine1402-2'-O)-methyltransferase
MSKPKGQLVLIPNSLGGPATCSFTPDLKARVLSINSFVVEEIRSARRWLKALEYPGDFSDVQFHLLNEHTKSHEVEALLLPLLQGHSMGLISEAGLPCIADPGAELVRAAHQFGIKVIPFVGASSIFLTLMASGLNGQQFSFNGYLPRDQQQRAQRIRQMEQLVRSQNQTQLFMDAPYRNDAVLETLLKVCHPDTLLCIAADVTCPSEIITTKSIAEWVHHPPTLGKRPVMFAIGRA